MSTVRIKDLDRRLHSILVVRALNGYPQRSLDNYAEFIEKAPRLVLVGHLLVMALRVLRGRSVA